MDKLEGRNRARTCQRCGKTYQGGGYKFCSRECMLGTGTCRKCGKEFQRSQTGQKTCADCFNRAEEKACPGCGKTFASKYGRAYCSKECYESARAHKPEPCPACGKEVPKGRRYCSKECRSRAHGTAHVCQQCGREFFRVNKKNKATKYCSPECSALAQTKRPMARCQQCGSEFRQGRNCKGYYCSKECQWASMRVIKACPQCGREFAGNRKFCSDECVEARFRALYEELARKR
ncbi:MAG: hypothetical protein IKR86_09320 [Candidatus Methanomethylophilaceae archaeon]|nr:hypothetical protein [Candidatus Methanomethylophilaceae archaeon]